MKTRFNKILIVITAITFVAALTLNIQASLSDPFSGMSDEAVALTTTDDDTLNASITYHPFVKHCMKETKKCTWRLISSNPECDVYYLPYEGSQLHYCEEEYP